MVNTAWYNSLVLSLGSVVLNGHCLRFIFDDVKPQLRHAWVGAICSQHLFAPHANRYSHFQSRPGLHFKRLFKLDRTHQVFGSLSKCRIGIDPLGNGCYRNGRIGVRNPLIWTSYISYQPGRTNVFGDVVGFRAIWGSGLRQAFVESHI